MDGLKTGGTGEDTALYIVVTQDGHQRIVLMQTRAPKLHSRHRPRERKDKEHTRNVKSASGVATFDGDRDEH